MHSRMRTIVNVEEHRWSEVVPPHTALTFAAIWDPEEGMVTFSGAGLLDAEPAHLKSATRKAPADAFDSQSQVLTIDRFALALGGASLDTCEAYTDIVDGIIDAYLDLEDRCPGAPPGIPPTPRSAALASSAALVSFVHEVDARAEKKTPFAGVRRRILPAAAKRTVHRASEERTIHDEGFFEERRLAAPVLVNLNLKSAFSVTTTSTSNYVEVDFPPEDAHADASSWSTLSDVDVDRAAAATAERPRRLRKVCPRKPPARPTDPAEVLAREHYNHVRPNSSASARPKSVVRAKALLNRLSNYRREDEDERWVCIEVTHKVTQRIV